MKIIIINNLDKIKSNNGYDSDSEKNNEPGHVEQRELPEIKHNNNNIITELQTKPHIDLKTKWGESQWKWIKDKIIDASEVGTIQNERRGK